mgnify:CR=1 FL=1
MLFRSQSLEAIAGKLADNVIVAGAAGVSYRFDGTTWKQLPTVSKYRIDGVAVTGSDALLVGDFGTILSWDGLAMQTRRNPSIQWGS